MYSKYLAIAESFEKLAECFRALADGDVQKVEPDAEKEPAVGIADVRKVLADKTQNGKGSEVKKLLEKYGAKKLSGIAAENYRALLKEAEVL